MIFSWVASSGADPEDQIATPEYVGTFGGSSRAIFEVSKRNRENEPVKGLFQAVRLAVTCTGGDQTKEYDAMKVRFFSGRAFSGVYYDLQNTGVQTLLAVEGRISRDGKEVDGELLILDNPGGEVECSSVGYIGWRAKKAKK